MFRFLILLLVHWSQKMNNDHSKDKNSPVQSQFAEAGKTINAELKSSEGQTLGPEGWFTRNIKSLKYLVVPALFLTLGNVAIRPMDLIAPEMPKRLTSHIIKDSVSEKAFDLLTDNQKEINDYFGISTAKIHDEQVVPTISLDLNGVFARSYGCAISMNGINNVGAAKSHLVDNPSPAKWHVFREFVTYHEAAHCAQALQSLVDGKNNIETRENMFANISMSNMTDLAAAKELKLIKENFHEVQADIQGYLYFVKKNLADAENDDKYKEGLKKLTSLNEDISNLREKSDHFYVHNTYSGVSRVIGFVGKITSGKDGQQKLQSLLSSSEKVYELSSSYASGYLIDSLPKIYEKNSENAYRINYENISRVEKNIESIKNEIEHVKKFGEELEDFTEIISMAIEVSLDKKIERLEERLKEFNKELKEYKEAGKSLTSDFKKFMPEGIKFKDARYEQMAKKDMDHWKVIDKISNGEKQNFEYSSRYLLPEKQAFNIGSWLKPSA